MEWWMNPDFHAGAIVSLFGFVMGYLASRLGRRKLNVSPSLVVDVGLLKTHVTEMEGRLQSVQNKVGDIQGTFDKVKGAMEEMLTEFANEESELRREVRELREEVSILQQDQTNLD